MAKQENGQKLTRKQKKIQRRALRQSQLALEKQLVAEGKIPQRNRYVARGFFWRMFSICLAFFFGIVIGVGGLFGGVLYAGTAVPTKDVIALFGKDYRDILEEDYADDSIFTLVSKIANTEFTSLSAIGQYTPLLEKTLNDAKEMLAEKGIPLDTEALMEVPFGEIGDYVQSNVVQKIVLGDVIGLNAKSDPILLALCYGSAGEDYTVEGDKIVMNEGKNALTVGDLTSGTEKIVERITIESALNADGESNAAVRFLAYGTEDVHYTRSGKTITMLYNPYTGEKFRKKTIADLSAAGETPLDTARISDLIDVSGATGIMAAIRDWKVSDLKDAYRIERLKIAQVMTIGDGSSLIAKAIRDWRIGDFADPDHMNSLTLGDVMEIDPTSPLILQKLASVPLGDFGGAIDTLRLCDILRESDLEGNSLLENLKNSTLDSLANDLQNLTFQDVFGDRVYSYMLYEGTSYEDLVKAYDPSVKDSARPEAYTLKADESVRTYRVRKGTETELSQGWVAENGGAPYLVESGDVLTRRTEEDGRPVFRHYAETEHPLLLTAENYDWRVVNYASRSLSPLGDGETVTTDVSDCGKVETAEGTPVLSDGSPLYFVTDRDLPQEGGGTARTKVAYPLIEDDYSIYYSYLKYTENGGANEYSLERVDLDRIVTSYTYRGNGGDEVLPYEDGKVVYGGQSYSVGARRTESGTEPCFKTETEVSLRYYDPADPTFAAVEEAQTEERYELSEADGGTKRLDRFLSGVWHLIFCVKDPATGATSYDAVQTKILDMSDLLSGVTETISQTPLWELYLYGVLDKDPYVEIPAQLGFTVGGKPVTNLNQVTILGAIDLVDQMSKKVGMLIPGA